LTKIFMRCTIQGSLRIVAKSYAKELSIAVPFEPAGQYV
jgi:hypothetical protein